MKNIIKILSEIGFSELEAKIYLSLLQEGRATGYKISKIIGKPVSNTYQALYKMQHKGLVIIDESKTPKECVPVQIKEYFSLKEKLLRDKHSIIEKILNEFDLISPQEGIFQIKEIAQVIEKGLQLIHDAKQLIMANLFHQPLNIFKEALEKKAAEGVKVLVKVYEPAELKGCHVIEHTYAHEMNLRTEPIDWHSDWCEIIVDDDNFLIAFFEKNGKSVYEALWSKNTYLDLILFSGFANKFILSMITKSIHAGKTSKEIQEDLKRFYNEYMYGFELIEKFRGHINSSEK